MFKWVGYVNSEFHESSIVFLTAVIFKISAQKIIKIVLVVHLKIAGRQLFLEQPLHEL